MEIKITTEMNIAGTENRNQGKPEAEAKTGNNCRCRQEKVICREKKIWYYISIRFTLVAEKLWF